jgi:hypothetical protein
MGFKKLLRYERDGDVFRSILQGCSTGSRRESAALSAARFRPQGQKPKSDRQLSDGVTALPCCGFLIEAFTDGPWNRNILMSPALTVPAVISSGSIHFAGVGQGGKRSLSGLPFRAVGFFRVSYSLVANQNSNLTGSQAKDRCNGKRARAITCRWSSPWKTSACRQGF